jgi:hypothetical protein
MKKEDILPKATLLRKKILSFLNLSDFNMLKASKDSFLLYLFFFFSSQALIKSRNF